MPPRGGALKGPTEQPADRPSPSTYWVIPDSFLAGHYPTRSHDDEAKNILRKYLRDAGITLFIDLTESGEGIGYHLLLRKVEEEEQEANGQVASLARYQNFPMQDFSTPSVERMKHVLDVIDEAVQKEEKVYVHCYGGIGRTGMVVGCYLVRHGNSGTEALAELNRLFQATAQSEFTQSPDTDEQINFIKNWKE